MPYISRIEAGARTPSVKALRQIAGKLGVTVEHLETGKPTPIEQSVTDAGLDFGSLTAKELRSVQAAADEGARESARQAAEHVIEDRHKAEVASLVSEFQSQKQEGPRSAGLLSASGVVRRR